jgi:hypothetical protein
MGKSTTYTGRSRMKKTLVLLGTFAVFAHSADTTSQVILTKLKSGAVIDKVLKRNISNSGMILSSLDSNFLTGTYYKSQFYYSGSNLIKFEAKPNGIINSSYSREYGYDSSNNLTKAIVRFENGDTNFTSSSFYLSGAIGQEYRDSAGTVVHRETVLYDSCQRSIGKNHWYQNSSQTIIDRKIIYGNTCSDTNSILTYSKDNASVVVSKAIYSNHKLISLAYYNSSDTSVTKKIALISYPSATSSVVSLIDYGLTGLVVNKSTSTSEKAANGNLLSKFIRDNNGGIRQGKIIGGASWTYSSPDSILTYSKFEMDSVESCANRTRFQRDGLGRVISSVVFDENCDTASFSTITNTP